MIDNIYIIDNFIVFSNYPYFIYYFLIRKILRNLVENVENFKLLDIKV